MKRFQWAILFLTLTISGCGGGGDGGTATTRAPVASNLVLIYSEKGKLNSFFDFADPEGDVTTITVALYDSKGAKLGDSTSQIADIAGHKSGTIQGTLNLSFLLAGDYSIEIYMTDSSGFQSNRISKGFSATGGLNESINYPNPSEYIRLGNTSIGDLNGDSRNDVVAIQESGYGKIQIYYQDAAGNLNNPIVLQTDIDAKGVAIGDVNNDGKADLVLSGRTLSGWRQGLVVVMLQDPVSGQLLQPHKYNVSSDIAVSLAIADLDGNGRNDIVVSTGIVSIFFQNSAGALNPEVIYDKVYGGEVHVADMDSDGRNDIVVHCEPKEFAVIRQTAPGIFTLTPDLYTAQTSYWSSFGAFALGDVNGDGRIDVVTSDPGNSGYLNIFLQNSQGKLDPPTLVQTDVPFGVKIADITGDGLNDIIYDMSGGIMVLPQQADHTFGPRHFYSYRSSTFGGSMVSQALSIGDVTGDGRLDAVLTWSDDGLYVFPYCAQFTVP